MKPLSATMIRLLTDFAAGCIVQFEWDDGAHGRYFVQNADQSVHWRIDPAVLRAAIRRRYIDGSGRELIDNGRQALAEHTHVSH